MDILTRQSASRGPGSPRVLGAYHEATGSIQYACICPTTGKAALIDVVLGFDLTSARTSTEHAQHMLDVLGREGLQLAWILDTHPHADHLMAAAWLRGQTQAPMAIGEKVRDIADLWRDLYHLPDAFDPDADFDRLWADGDTFAIGDLEAKVLLSPGHTLGSVTYIVGDAIFAHDTFMQPDSGTARCDFPGGSARDLHSSLMAILDHPDDARIFVGHDYGTDAREEPAWESTVAEQRETNKHVSGGTSEDEYVEIRETRDATLDLPKQMLHALQVNLRGGRLPPVEADGRSYFKIPANRF